MEKGRRKAACTCATAKGAKIKDNEEFLCKLRFSKY